MRIIKSFTLIILISLSVSPANATIIGSVSGVFTDPFPSSPPSVTTGIGTDTVTFGIPCDGVTNCTASFGVTPPNSLKFDPVLGFTTEIGEVFDIGTLTFFNGSIQRGTEISMITLSLLLIGDPLIDGLSKDRSIDIINTANTSDPISSADFLSIGLGPMPSSFHVLEAEEATATIRAIIFPDDLRLDILGFGEVISGSGFITNPVSVVPLPAALPLFLTGLAGLALIRRRRRQA